MLLNIVKTLLGMLPIKLLVFYAYVERTIAPDHQMGLN